MSVTQNGNDGTTLPAGSDMQQPLPNVQDQQTVTDPHRQWLEEMRGWLMVIATLVAGITYQADLNPPGRFWQQDDSQGHLVGYPVLADKFEHRYDVFFYCNATSFAMSLIIILLLVSQRFYHTPTKIKVLALTMVLDLIGLMCAYTAGSCRKLKPSVYVVLLVIGVFCYVMYLTRLFEVLNDVARGMLGRGQPSQGVGNTASA